MPLGPQDAVHGGHRNRQAVEGLQVIGDLPRSEVVVLPEVQNLADHLARYGAR